MTQAFCNQAESLLYDAKATSVISAHCRQAGMLCNLCICYTSCRQAGSLASITASPLRAGCAQPACSSRVSLLCLGCLWVLGCIS